ncbi:MAG: hypothetical protein LQ338_004409 [Usnochroma carphineum]|nr:MAG: hypothetical protein LQ338_004409 [Usnochroma carphineum]
MSFLYSLLYSKLHPPRNPTSSFAGQTVLVTGANCGLGFEAALKFVSLGASTVILTCRTPSKGQEAKQQIEERTGRKDVCRVIQLEMGSFESIRAFTEQVNEVGNLDIALLNAGVVQPDYRLSKEGWEETLQVNVLGTTMLGSILLHMMRQSKAPPSASGMKHLCFVSSGNYASASLSPQALASPNLLEYFNERDHFGGPEPQYNISKLFLMYAANELAASVDTGSEKDDEKEESVVVVNSVNPGATATNLTRNITGVVLRIVAYIYLSLLARTAEEGSRSLVSACAQGKESHGQLWQDDRIEGTTWSTALKGTNYRKEYGVRLAVQ